MLNHTEGAESSYVMRLSGGYGENVGLAKSISVMPGDTIRMEVFGKYIDIAEAKRGPAIMAVLIAITAADPVAMEDRR
jgi:ABC-type taurine transport system ATPase subunit